MDRDFHRFPNQQDHIKIILGPSKVHPGHQVRYQNGSTSQLGYVRETVHPSNPGAPHVLQVLSHFVPMRSDFMQRPDTTWCNVAQRCNS